MKPDCKCTTIGDIVGTIIPPGGSIETSAMMEGPAAGGNKKDAAATRSDGSVVYAHFTWEGRPVGEEALVGARAEVRETRYGFGRERRTIVLFMKQPPTPDLEHIVLRDANVEWIDAERLVVGARAPSRL